ncbi:succinate dehydrogenase cytochrome b subunit [uncultured Friedmanniella sp.]|uniref:succinate dehydrogenase cytochrome b subunit n=1 Tax=uncultured Friedmanniella sp. TaxID=335381 RepID=UPI0035CB4A04
MATTTLTPTQRAVRTTVALKALMAVSGLIMVGFLLAHMYGNLKVFAGQESFDGYAHHLRTIGQPILPYAGLLWIIRVVLLASVVGHAYAAVKLWARAKRARGGGNTKRYQSTKGRTGVQRTYASFTLRWGGIVILLFVIFHLLQFTWGTVHPGGASGSPYQRVVNGFGVWWVVVAYTVAMIAVGFHLRHGMWSALTTLGANTSAIARRRLNLLAYAVAGVITAGFLLPPYSILLGLVS